MINHNRLKVKISVLVATVIIISSSFAMAAPDVSINPLDIYGPAGSTFRIDIVLDSTAPAISSCSFGIRYDNAELDFIQLNESTPSPLIWNIWGNYHVNESAGMIEHINAGTFSGSAPAGGFTLASIEFRILTHDPDKAGPEQVDIVFYEDPGEGWLDSSNSAFSVNYRGGDVNAAISSDPIPDIRANDSHGPLEITSGDTLSVTVTLSAGDRAQDPADWWVLAETPFDWYYYDLTSGWLPGVRATYKGPLLDLPSFEVLNLSGLTAGVYTLYFGVDMNMNGWIDIDQIYYDSVELTVGSP